MAGFPPPPPGPPPPPPSPYGASHSPYAAAYPPPQPWQLTGPAPGLRYAGFWIRFLAYIVDAIIIDIPVFAVAYALIAPTIPNISCSNVDNGLGATVQCTGLNQLTSTFWLIALVGFVIGGVYFVVMWSRFGQTLGQKLCGLRVVDAATGERIPLGRAVGRYIGFLVSAWVLYIGLIWVAGDSQKQGWHDKMASTFVVRRA
jgi:uncharacterized RDD family membrane protein YckC